VQGHALHGEGAQVDVVPAVAAGDVVVGAEPHRVGVVELVDAAGVGAHVVEPGDDVAAAVPAGDARRGTGGQVHGAAREVQVLGDLAARLAGADDEHGPFGELLGVLVRRGVQLRDPVGDALGHPRDARHLVRAGGHDDLVGGDRAAVGADLERAVGAAA
jgi:hypothetical protein